MKLLEKIRNTYLKNVQYTFNSNYGKPLWNNYKDEQYIKEAYNQIVWVYACVNKIAGCVASVPFCLYRYRANKKYEVTEHVLLDMFNNKINNNMNATDFFEFWASYLALQGKFYALMNNSALPTQLELLYPHMTQIVPSKKDFIQKYEYRIDSERYNYKKEQVLWSKFNDPLDVYGGLSPIKALSRTIDTENSTIDWNKTAIDNSAVPAGIIQVMNPSPELQNKLRLEWLKRYGGSKNAKVPLVLDSEKASYQSLGLSPLDMDFINQRKLSRIEICTAFGVPSQVVGDPEGQTYANFGEAIASFWENTIIPNYLNKIESCLNQYVVSKYADNLRIEYNTDSIKALHESIDSITERTVNLWEKGLITRNEGRHAIGYGEIKDNDIFIEEMRANLYTQYVDNANAEDETDYEEIENEEGKKKNEKSFDLKYEEKRKFWEDFENARVAFYDYGINEYKKLFENERQILAEIETTTLEEFENIAIETINKNLRKHKKLLKNLYKRTMVFFSAKTKEELKKLKSKKEIESIDFYDVLLEIWIDETTAEKVVQITDTTKNQIKKMVQKSQANGLSINELAGLIDTLYLQQIIPNRSETIARTEVIASSNQASLLSAMEYDLGLKKIWIPTFDQRTRDTHFKMLDHPPINLDEDFKVGNSFVRTPADPRGEAKEVINCRCAIGYVDAEDNQSFS